MDEISKDELPTAMQLMYLVVYEVVFKASKTIKGSEFSLRSSSN
jgi:hypothetical protein